MAVVDLRGTALGGRYELHALIGEGASGRVYRGHDRRLDRPVAVKVIAAADLDLARLERETRLLARCSDPGIVRIFDVGDGPEGAFIVSELVDGEDLATHLARGVIDVARAREIARGLCAGLAAAHALGIVHRDVKPANVLLGPGGGVQVTDFGVARLLDDGDGSLTATGSVVGTPRYMAPEQSRGETVGPPADVYGAGAVLYEMLAGRPPFAERSPAALARAHDGDPPPPLPAQIPAALRGVVTRALAKDPAERYPDAAAMARALDPDAGDAGAPSRRDGVTATLRAPRRAPRVVVRPAGRRRAVALLTAVGALLAALVAAAVLTRDSGRRRPAAAHRTAVARRVEVPLVVGQDRSAATATLRGLGLRVLATPVPAPGIRPGTVVSSHPAPGASAPAGATVRLSISEVPRWHDVTSVTARHSGPLTIRGDAWRILVTAHDAGACTLLVFCRHSRIAMSRVGATSATERLDLADGVLREFRTGPGTYALTVTPASGSTRWSITVQDLY